MSDDKASIIRTGKKLRAARRKNHFTQAEIAKKAGISENHYAQIERGEKNPTISNFKKIIKAIGVMSTEILGD
ncbi:MAG TPA: helix-turn-helix transcriptional regulator [Candidatus Saccharimonadales bacterium]|nr:helix-turn-helix transcriptional regulator [Candidatus Saccharimonadales bacterium]